MDVSITDHHASLQTKPHMHTQEHKKEGPSHGGSGRPEAGGLPAGQGPASVLSSLGPAAALEGDQTALPQMKGDSSPSKRTEPKTQHRGHRQKGTELTGR